MKSFPVEVKVPPVLRFHYQTQKLQITGPLWGESASERWMDSSDKRASNATGLHVMMSWCTVYPKKYAHGFVVLCFVVVMQSFIMNSHEVFIHIHQGCFAGTAAIVRLPQCQWSKPDGYGKISQCITTTKHSKAKTVCIFLGIYCTAYSNLRNNPATTTKKETYFCSAWNVHKAVPLSGTMREIFSQIFVRNIPLHKIVTLVHTI